MTAAILALALNFAAAPPDSARFDGTWLIDDYHSGQLGVGKQLGRVGKSGVVIKGDGFTLKNFHDYAGKFRLDPKRPAHVDLLLPRLDVYPILGWQRVIDAGPRRGVYQLTGDALKISFAEDIAAPRPATPGTEAARVMRLVLTRVPAGVGPAEEFEVTVTGPDGKPAGNVQIAAQGASGGVRTYMPLPDNYAALTGIAARWLRPYEEFDPTPRLFIQGLARTDAAGKAELKRAEFADGFLVAYDSKTKNAAFAPVAQSQLATGRVAVKLAPCREILAEFPCPGLPADAEHTHNARIYANGHEAAYSVAQGGRVVRFFAPPGQYVVNVSSHLTESKSFRLTVPAGEGSFHAPPMPVEPNAGAKLLAKPAPELKAVTASRGGSIKLSDYKGKYVVLDFWGYWCAPCLRAMPTWMAVHDHFKGEVIVIAVHQDLSGEVPTFAEYDAKMKAIRKGYLKGRELPFPVALVSGADDGHSGPSGQFGVTSYPTTLLIGPDGKLIGEFGHRDGKSAIAALEAVLNPTKLPKSFKIPMPVLRPRG